MAIIKMLLFWVLILQTTNGSHSNHSHNKLTGVGINVVNIFWERLQHVLAQNNDDTDAEMFVNGKNPKHSFNDLKSKGIDLVRFAASPYCQSEFSMWRQGGKQEEVYWQILDDIMNEANQAGVRLIPTLIWRARMPSLACQEPFSMLFQSEKPSCARSLIRLYATDVVKRYQNFDNIVAWELFNELNLQVDLNHKVKRAACHWDVHKKTNVCTASKAAKKTQETTVNSTSVDLLSKQQANEMTTLGPQCLSTSRESHACNCSGNKISNADDFSTQDMSLLYRDFSGWVREVDVRLRRPISSGQAMPRPGSWHLAYTQGSQRWQADSAKQFCDHFLETHAHVELASIHPYIHTKPGTNGSSIGDEVVFSMDGRSVKLLSLVRLAHRCIQQAKRPYPNQLYIGEFGYKQGSNASLAFVRHVLDMVKEETTSSDRMAMNGLSGHDGHVDDSEQEEMSLTPPLITMWVWEFKPQHDSLSIENERDSWLITEIAAANKLAKSTGLK